MLWSHNSGAIRGPSTSSQRKWPRIRYACTLHFPSAFKDSLIVKKHRDNLRDNCQAMYFKLYEVVSRTEFISVEPADTLSLVPKQLQGMPLLQII